MSISPHHPDRSAPWPQKHIRLELTEEQKAQVKAATGKDARAIELNAEELEERIAPMRSSRRVTKHPSAFVGWFRPLLSVTAGGGAQY